MYFVAVEPQLQNQGIPALLICALLKNLIKNGVKYCETGPMLESNTAVQSLWRRYDKVQHKRRRCYIKSI
jgi:ribosomal protein S18 acetylase RimI-like enzyme